MASEMTTLREQLRQGGYCPIPVNGKIPAPKAWQQKSVTNKQEIELWERIFIDASNTGILTAFTPAIDIDITVEPAAEAIESLARERFEERGFFLVRIGKPPKRAVLLRTDEPFNKITRNVTGPDGSQQKIEILCDGQQIVVFGIHPETRLPYHWHGGDPARIIHDDLPYIGQNDALAFADEAVTILVADYGYQAGNDRPRQSKQTNGADPHGAADWSWLLENIKNGSELHDSSAALAAKLLAAGMSDGAAINLIRAAFATSTATRDERFAERFADIGRCVTSARQKIAKPPTPEPAQPKIVPVQSKQTFLAGFKPPNYQIERILQHGFFYGVTGQTGHAKTAIALLIAELIASNDNNAMLGRYKIEKGRVVYFAGENADDVRMRVMGADWVRRKAGEDPSQDTIWFVPGQFSIPEMRAYLIKEFTTIGGVDLIIVDTSAAYFLGRDEIDNVEMGAHARMLRTLTELPRHPCVIALCHPIKHVETPDQLLPRGGGAMLAELDGNLTLFKESEDIVELNYTKMRGPGFDPVKFQLVKVEPDNLIDAKGNKIPTIRASVITDVQDEQIKRKTRDVEDRILRAYLANPQVSHADICIANSWLDHKGFPIKSKISKALKELQKIGFMRKQRDEWALTEKGKEEARKLAIAAARVVAEQDQGKLL